MLVAYSISIHVWNVVFLFRQPPGVKTEKNGKNTSDFF